MKARWLRFVWRPRHRDIRLSGSHRWLGLRPCRYLHSESNQNISADQGIHDPFFSTRSSSPTTTPSLLERRLLGKARLNGIDSLAKLEFETDIGHTENIGSRMTDQPQHRQDLDLWLLLLEFSQHRHGVKGSRAIWKAMMFRGTPVQLEDRNRNASDLVQSIITSAVHDTSFLKDFCLACVHRSIFLQQLFVWVVGTLLLLEPKVAPSFAILLKNPCYQGKQDLLEVLESACLSERKHEALDRYWQVRISLPDVKVYNEVMSVLLRADHPDLALMLHKRLIVSGDLPRTFDVLKPHVRHLVASEGDLEGFLKDLAACDVSFEAQIRRYHASLAARTSRTHSAIESTEKKDSDPRKPSDETIARALATFPFDFAVNTLRMFGLIEVGPLSVRQFVRSSGDSKTLKERFDALREYEIDIGSSAFVRIQKRLAYTGMFETAKMLADSDMHHDEFESRDLQRRLLKQHYLNENLQNLNNTLTVLALGHMTPVVQSKSVNLLLRSAIAASDWPKTLDLVHQVCEQNHELEKYTPQYLAQELLLPRDEVGDSFDRVGFLIGVLQRLLAAGKPMQPAIWERPLAALGMQGRFDEFEALSVWLAAWYNSHSAQHHVFDRDLTKLFTPSLQRSLIAWSFSRLHWKNDTVPRQPSLDTSRSYSNNSAQPWLRGARLMKKLRDEHNIKVALADMQTELNVRLRLTRRKANTQPNMTTEHYLRSWTALWEEALPPDVAERRMGE